MEISFLKQLFFIGEQEKIDEFCATLKARCVKNGDIQTVQTEYGIEKVMFNSENNTYFTQHMVVLSECNGELVKAETIADVTIVKQQRIQPNGHGSHFKVKERVSSKALSEGTFVVPELNSDEYLYVDNPYTIPVAYKDGNEVKCGWIDTRKDYNINFKHVEVYDEADNEFVVVDTKMLFDINVLTSVYHGPYMVAYCMPEYVESKTTLFDHCSDCGKIWLKRLLTDGRCPNCDRPIEICGYHRHDYHKVFGIGESNRNAPWYMGIELESQGSRQNTRALRSVQDIFHPERDGSIDNGFETVSESLTWKAWKENEGRTREMLNKFLALGQHAENSQCCGFHIHLSSKAFSGTPAIRKAQLLVYGMSSEFQKLARRGKNNYCEYYEVSKSPTYEDYAQMARLTSRYYGVNISNVGNRNKDTVEFRIFQGTLDGDTIFASMELVKNIMEVVNDSSKGVIKFGDLVYGDYLPAYAERFNINKELTMDFRKINAFQIVNSDLSFDEMARQIAMLGGVQ